MQQLTLPLSPTAQREAQQWAQADSKHHFITLEHIDYPGLLKHIATPPPQLYVIGNLACLQYPQLAMVGSRRMTHYGEENAYQFARDLAQKGLFITSGLAYVIDAQAHQGCLDALGATIAVLGSGIDQITPKQHVKLAEKIIATGGAIVSEFPLGMPALPHHFPQRNRIITGLSLGTLVVEATLKSGSLLSARLAMEQNRAVFAIPGSIHSPMSKGCHQLLKQGAKCVESSADILLELSPLLASYIDQPTSTADSKTPSMARQTLDAEHIAVLEQVDYDVTPVDSIIRRSRQPAQLVAGILLTLELNGYVSHTAGGYIKCKDTTRE